MNKKELKILKRHLNMKNEIDREIFESVKNGDLSVVITPIRGVLKGEKYGKHIR